MQVFKKTRFIDGWDVICSLVENDAPQIVHFVDDPTEEQIISKLEELAKEELAKEALIEPQIEEEMVNGSNNE